jgi:hypothetical protein
MTFRAKVKALSLSSFSIQMFVSLRRYQSVRKSYGRQGWLLADRGHLARKISIAPVNPGGHVAVGHFLLHLLLLFAEAVGHHGELTHCGDRRCRATPYESNCAARDAAGARRERRARGGTLARLDRYRRDRIGAPSGRAAGRRGEANYRSLREERAASAPDLLRGPSGRGCWRSMMAIGLPSTTSDSFKTSG